MAGTRHEVACIATLLFIGVGTFVAGTVARPSSIIVADDAAKKAQDQVGGPIPGAARFHVDGEFRSAPTLFRQGRFAEAERQFAWIARVRKDTAWGERAEYYLAECQYQQKKYVSAIESFERLHYDYPATEHLERLVSREYEIARFWLAQSDPRLPVEKTLPWTARLDGRLPLLDIRGSALRALEHVERNNPCGPLAPAASIQIADDYMERRDYSTAGQYYDQFLQFYRRSPLRSRAWLAAIEARIRGDIEPRWDAAVSEAREQVEQLLRHHLESRRSGQTGRPLILRGRSHTGPVRTGQNTLTSPLAPTTRAAGAAGDRARCDRGCRRRRARRSSHSVGSRIKGPEGAICGADRAGRRDGADRPATG